MNRTDVEWIKLTKHIKQYNYTIKYADKDGYCLISALRLCLLYDHGEMYTNDAIAGLVRSEIYNNNQYYRRFYHGEVEDMLETLEEYLTKGKYSQQIVDIVVLAAAKCLSVNLCIYKKLGDIAQLYMQPSNPPSTRDVYLHYNNEHYDAIVSNQTKCIPSDGE